MPWQRRAAAVAAGAIGLPMTIWFNDAILPTDGPGPIGLGTVILILLLTFPDDRTRF